jgi:hypothetical protein
MRAGIPTPSSPAIGSPIERRKWPRRLAALVLLVVVLWGAYSWWNRREPQAPTEIFAGVTYGCDRLRTSAEGSGLVHWVRVDLTTPGIELYVTPLDPIAVEQGWQYRLRRTEDVIDSERLAVVINACLFTSNSGWLRMSGDLAKSVETVVSNHVVSHLWEHTYLLWFDDRLTPHLKPSKPPTAAELALALWGIGGQGVGLRNGRVAPGPSEAPNSHTAVAIDPERKLLFLAVAEYIAPRLLLEKLGELGAKDGMLLDGGGSSSMAIGQGASGVRPGLLHHRWRPVATHFGVRARPVQAAK